MKKVFKYILLALGAFTLIGIIGVALDKPEANAAPDTLPQENSEKKPIANEWSYSQYSDKMDGTETKSATINSTNDIDFELPYGNSTFSLTTRKTKKNTDVILQCTRCQFMAGLMGERTYRVKFDDEAPFKVVAMHADASLSDIVFLGSESKLISKLKTAKKLTIEAVFFDAGKGTVEFDVAGFTW